MRGARPEPARPAEAQRRPRPGTIVHDQKDPEAVLANVHTVLKPGGTFLMQDIGGSSHLENNLDHPVGPFGYTISTMHCMTVSLSQGGAGLGTMWGEELAEAMLSAAGAGFTGVLQEAGVGRL